MSHKLILVIGATGAQGIAVIDALLEAKGGSPSPYRVRALTRDPTSRRAQELTTKGVECFKGSFDDFAAVEAAFQGVYGAWVNTDSFTVGEMREIYAGLRIFEIAKRTASVRHYVWSNLDYIPKTRVGYNPTYAVDHYNGKGRVAEFLKAQDSIVSDRGLSWSCVSTGPYMESLHSIFAPFNQRKDGTFVFASPIADGHMPIIALSDIGFWARYSFDHRAETSGKDLKVASQMLGWDALVQTFTKVTGQKAVFLRLSMDAWWANFNGADKPVANECSEGDGSKTARENFTAWLSLYRDDVIERDMEWIKRVHPGTKDVETWMRETGYTGKIGKGVLKNTEDDKNPFRANLEKMRLL